EYDPTQTEQDEEPDRERDELHLPEVSFVNFGHADVVIQQVDLHDVLPFVAPHELIAVDPQIQPLAVLRRYEVNVPEREEEGQGETDTCAQDQHPREHAEALAQKTLST